MSIRTVFEKNTYLNDVQEIPRAFVPYLQLDDEGENYLSWHYTVRDGIFYFYIESDIFGNAVFEKKIDESNELLQKRQTKYFAKNCLYGFLSKALDVRLPYGSLTGVRPTRMYFEVQKHEKEPKSSLIHDFSVLESKAELIERCALFQKDYINKDPSSVEIYVNIPFCPTRCSYCSFISTEVFRVKKEIPLFVDCVKKDIEKIFDIISEKGYAVRAVYVGGGTPTSIGADSLGEILTPLSKLGCEFTVECGRPDTIDRNMMDVLVKNNVTRVSVNPQSFHQKTLDLIGRKHSTDDIYRAFSLAKEAKFDINCDLIAALPGEDLSDFSYSLNEARKLRPDNITVHTLSIKRGSELNKIKTEKRAGGEALQMTELAFSALSEDGYDPYYMYRQKNTADNLENTGFCRDGKVCLYNVDTMEESSVVLAAGAGAVSKLLSDVGRITRFSHPKGFREYIERHEETLRNLKEFFTES